ncbi:MAG: hypothetical protein LPK45_07680 [Bacteroidota bacterium]|nr:hypothetical protein [Bacteroidota bacterium]MDX5430952.1 hypothetical protein [Bacteroidota bacterium]MDX5469700.1 hypothetical protein [Bacteroidota bacterium]
MLSYVFLFLLSFGGEASVAFSEKSEILFKASSYTFLWDDEAQEGTVSTITEPLQLIKSNKRLKRNGYVLGGISVILLLTILGLWVQLRKLNKRLQGFQVLEPADKEEEEMVRGDEVAQLKEALNVERARVVKHEVQKKELLAYIEELKSEIGNTQIKRKSVEIQRIFAEHKSDEIVNKVEFAAKTLYPDLVENLRKGYPDLNDLEVQYCLMLALGYNLDEVMAVLGRSEKAIKSLRYRIRKKIQLEDQVNLRDFVLEINSQSSENQNDKNFEA